jgi:radical SAM superfamily enzyme YgiQ (UPF0313 family)
MGSDPFSRLRGGAGSVLAGCPFDCEFCDIVVLYGRKPRSNRQSRSSELNALVDAGWRDSIFIVDDNFIGHKSKAKALLRAMIALA